MTEEELLFTYHAPNDVTKPQYIAVRDIQHRMEELIDRPIGINFDDVNNLAKEAYRITCSGLLLGLHEKLALEHVILWRNAMNEMLATGHVDDVQLIGLARNHALQFRWAACGGIAAGDAKYRSG